MANGGEPATGVGEEGQIEMGERRQGENETGTGGVEALGLGLGERSGGVGRMEARGWPGAAAGAPLYPAPLGWAGSRPPTALCPAWPGERAVGCAWAAMAPIGPVFSGCAWTHPAGWK